MMKNNTMHLKHFILSLVFISFCTISCATDKSAITHKKMEPVDMVYPFLDSENSRWFYFSSACRPFGMVNLSPDTEIDGAWASGYCYNTDTVKGFSHIHAWQLSGISVMPLHLLDGDKKSVYTDFYSSFSHDTESASPGFHELTLDRSDIRVELTSTTRVGFHKYIFSDKNADPAVLFNLNIPKLGPAANTDGKIEQLGEKRLVGELVCASTLRRPRGVKIYFKVLFDKPLQAIEKDKETGNYLAVFDPEVKELKMKVSISYTSQENAIKNMNAELSHWNFNRVKQESRKEWNDYLSRIEIEDEDFKQRSRFYTDLWKVLQGNRIISDVNGAYPDNTGPKFRIGQVPLDEKGKPAFNHYNSVTFWGGQWTTTTVWQLVYPEIAEGLINSYLMYYKDGGLIPRGPSGGNYTYVMTGSTFTPFLVAAYHKGIRGYDVELAYEGSKKNHLPGGMMSRVGYEHNTQKGGGIELYIEKGYVPHPTFERILGYHQDGASLTLEYAYQDWTLAQLALSLGKKDDYDYFMKRSDNYANLFDPESGWMRAKKADGSWYHENFDPYEAYAVQNAFTEGNAVQWTWFVPHDLKGLVELMGGEEKAAKKLNQQFEEASLLNFTSGTSHSVEKLSEYRRIPINYGNQPSIQTAFVFNQLGRPDLTQYWSREVTERVYGGLGTGTGYSGDEDNGMMGALAILYKLGLFQMDGGTSVEPYYELGSPIFDKVTIWLNRDYYQGKKFVIETENNSKQNRYIKSVVFNGSNVEGVQITHKQLTEGGLLKIQMKP